MRWYGIDWRIGRQWGIADPKHNCYADAGQVATDPNNEYNPLFLGIRYQPRDLLVEGSIGHYDYAVGYISSLQTFKYGEFSFTFRLPQGKQLWPAIWLTDGRTWPPEIDIMEGWSGDDLTRPYRRNALAHDIRPCLHYGDRPSNHRQRPACRLLGGVPNGALMVRGLNTCRLVWTADKIEVSYNGRRVFRCTDKNILRWYNESEGMEIHLNNYVSNDKTDTSGEVSPFVIYDLKIKQL